MEILVLAARGLSNHQIATHLRLSEATVKRHLANIYGKMAVGSRSEAVRIALTQQWIGLTQITAGNGSDGSKG
jgi:DNA-binding NarL/FixJ family response regulator